METHIATLKGKGKNSVRVLCGPCRWRMMIPGEPQEIFAAEAEVLKKNPNVTVKAKETALAKPGAK